MPRVRRPAGPAGGRAGRRAAERMGAGRGSAEPAGASQGRSASAPAGARRWRSVPRLPGLAGLAGVRRSLAGGAAGSERAWACRERGRSAPSLSGLAERAGARLCLPGRRSAGGSLSAGARWRWGLLRLGEPAGVRRSLPGRRSAGGSLGPGVCWRRSPLGRRSVPGRWRRRLPGLPRPGWCRAARSALRTGPGVWRYRSLPGPAGALAGVRPCLSEGRSARHRWRPELLGRGWLRAGAGLLRPCLGGGGGAAVRRGGEGGSIRVAR